MIFISALFITSCVSAVTWYVAYNHSMRELQKDLHNDLELSLSSLQSEIERFKYLPAVIAQDNRVIEVLNNPSKESQLKANTYLEKIQKNSLADKLYVLDENGTTLASSNWKDQGSFVGYNYHFRPYYIQALRNTRGSLYAVGVTTGEAGYFLSYLVSTAEGRKGVAVVKLTLSGLENTWRRAANSMGLIDKNGMIFLSGNKEWKYHPVFKLTSLQKQRMLNERTYPQAYFSDAKPLISEIDRQLSNDKRFVLPSIGHILKSEKKQVIASINVEADDWILFATENISIVENAAWFYSLLVGLIGLLISVGYFFIRQRQHLIQLKLNQHSVLEKKVKERTRALAKEIEVRRSAEKELVEAQEGLIQSAKLAALGRMSAAIVHEISQPLSAMDATLATAEAKIANDLTPNNSRIETNLENSRSLVKRMQRTVKHLKTFSKKDRAEYESVNLVKTVQAAIEIAAPRSNSLGVEINFEIPEEIVIIMANSLRIEQVILNLLLNSLDAIEGVCDGFVTVDINRTPKSVEIHVIDNGTGVDIDLIERLKEPFFTTKKTGGSLGLGLSISTAIIEEYNGELKLKPHDPKGTIAIVSLPSEQITNNNLILGAAQ